MNKLGPILLAASLLALTSCAGGVSSVPFPTPTQAAVDAAAQQVALTASGLAPKTLWENEQLANGYACDAWLAQQFAQSRALSTAGQLGGLVSGAITPFNPLAGFAGQLFSSAVTTLGNAGTLPYAVATAPQVRAAMQSYAQAAPAPMTLAEAGILGEGQLWWCTAPGITSLANTAIDTAKVSALSSVLPLRAFFAGPAPPRGFVPPTVKINGR